MRKIMFPNYLNSPRVILFWEADELKFVIAVLVSIFAILFVFNAPTYMIVFTEAIIVPISLEAYRRITKETPPGWFRHFLYLHNILPAVDKSFLKSHGFDTKTDIIPPSFITTFED